MQPMKGCSVIIGNTETASVLLELDKKNDGKIVAVYSSDDSISAFDSFPTLAICWRFWEMAFLLA